MFSMTVPEIKGLWARADPTACREDQSKSYKQPYADLLKS